MSSSLNTYYNLLFPAGFDVPVTNDFVPTDTENRLGVFKL